MVDNRGCFSGQFVGNGSSGFLVQPSISAEAIDKALAEIANKVFQAFDFARNLFGDNDFASGVASTLLDKDAMYNFTRKQVLDSFADVVNTYGIENIYIMIGKPGYYGTHTIYICKRDFVADNSDEIRNNTRNGFYGALPLPIAKITSAGVIPMNNTKAVLDFYKGCADGYHYEFD